MTLVLRHPNADDASQIIDQLFDANQFRDDWDLNEGGREFEIIADALFRARYQAFNDAAEFRKILEAENDRDGEGPSTTQKSIQTRPDFSTDPMSPRPMPTPQDYAVAAVLATAIDFAREPMFSPEVVRERTGVILAKDKLKAIVSWPAIMAGTSIEPLKIREQDPMSTKGVQNGHDATS